MRCQNDDLKTYSEHEDVTFLEPSKKNILLKTNISKKDLVCRINTWNNINLNLHNFNENQEIHKLHYEQRLLRVLFNDSDIYKSKCNFKILNEILYEGDCLDKNSASLKENSQNSEIIAEGNVSYSCLKPKLPHSEIRKSLMLLQENELIYFAAQILSIKKLKVNQGLLDPKNECDEYQIKQNRDSEYKFIININIHLYLHQKSLKNLNLSKISNAKSSIKNIIGWIDENYKLPSIDVSNYKKKSRQNAKIIQIKSYELYDLFKDYNLSMKRMGSLCWEQPYGLKSNLRNYQKDAVIFAKMIEEEKVSINFEYPPYWHLVDLPKQKNDFKLYANLITGELSKELPIGGGNFTIKGGCLCDEMGLGKSLEIISLILLNQKKVDKLENKLNLEYFLSKECFKNPNNTDLRYNYDDIECPCGTNISNIRTERCYICKTRFHFQCCVSQLEDNNCLIGYFFCPTCENTLLNKLKVKATLIIAPGSIVDQWNDEINKHVECGVLKVAKYDGVRAIQMNLRNNLLNKSKKTSLNSESENWIKTRNDISNYDIILTSYEILKEEIYHVLEKEKLLNKRSLRYKKTYPILPSFLTNIDWWRIVLDEAQMTEGYSLVSKMTSKLSCNYKWCVSGTPIIRSCSNDLYGLLSNLSNVGFPFIEDTHFKKYINFISYTHFINNGKSQDSNFEKNSIHNFQEQDKEILCDQNQDADEEFQYESYQSLYPDNSISYMTNKFGSIKNIVDNLEILIGSIFYRREMKQVQQEINIPKAFYGKTILNLSSVERFFYLKQCESTFNNIQNNVHKISNFSSLPNKKEFDSIITILRLACIHPQLGSMGINKRIKNMSIEKDGLTSLNNGLKIMTMNQILDKLLNKCRIDIEESVRKYVMNTLGLAGLYIYKKNFKKAVEFYNQVIDIRNEDRVDILQQIHTLWNLSEAYEILNKEVEKKKIQELKIECKKLEDNYIFKYFEDYREKYESYNKSREKSTNLNYKNTLDNWWHVFKKISSHQENSLLDRINNFLYEYRSAKDGDICCQLPNITNVNNLINTLDNRIREMQDTRTKLINSINQLNLIENIDDHLILTEIASKVSSCQICKENLNRNNHQNKTKKKTKTLIKQEFCFFCTIQKEFESFEYSLYTIKKKISNSIFSFDNEEFSEYIDEKKLRFDSTYLRDSEIIALIKLLNKEIRKIFDTQNEHVSKVLAACVLHLKYIESLKSELLAGKLYVSSLRQLVNSYLELIDCKQRIQVIEEFSEFSDQNNIVNSNEVPYLIERYELERNSALIVRKSLKSQQKFLCNLKLQERLKFLKNNELENDKNETFEIEICPICLNKIQCDSHVLLPCAHILCIDCYKLIKKSSRVKNLCPKCRSTFLDINVVLIIPDDSTNLNSDRITPISQIETNFLDNQEIIYSKKILGNFGTKIEAIIKHIKWILEFDENLIINSDLKLEQNSYNIMSDDKILIFSDFQQVLDIISTALSLNEILFKKYNGGKSEYKILREFTENQDHRVLICSHLNVGKGVNITAANHIIFISPLINKSDELQSIGRIIRMGQKKKPHIWHFVIKDSIEELIFHSLQDNENKLFLNNNQPIYLKLMDHLFETNNSVINIVNS